MQAACHAIERIIMNHCSAGTTTIWTVAFLVLMGASVWAWNRRLSCRIRHLSSQGQLLREQQGSVLRRVSDMLVVGAVLVSIIVIRQDVEMASRIALCSAAVVFAFPVLCGLRTGLLPGGWRVGKGPLRRNIDIMKQPVRFWIGMCVHMTALIALLVLITYGMPD